MWLGEDLPKEFPLVETAFLYILRAGGSLIFAEAFIQNDSQVQAEINQSS